MQESKRMMVAKIQAMPKYVTAMTTCATPMGSVIKIDNFKNNSTCVIVTCCKVLPMTLEFILYI